MSTNPAKEREIAEAKQRKENAKYAVATFARSNDMTFAEKQSLESMASGALAEPTDEVLARLLHQIRTRQPRPGTARPE